MHYAPYEEAGGAPNVIVDGAPTTGTVLTLSHWPHSPVPAGLEADLSAEMAFGYLARPDLHGRAEVVSNNHFDQDGLVSVFALVHRSRDAARASMTIAAFADPARSPLGVAPPDYGEWAAALYTNLLGRLVEITEHPDRY